MANRPLQRRQGFVVIALVALLLLFGTYVALASLDLSAVRVDRDRVTNEALAKAKEALIAYAVSDNNRPGELPCPDVNDDGVLTLGTDFGGGGVCTSLIGRLPWRTLDVPDLRDDSGERLWYALSADFRAGNGVVLNNDTAYRPGNASLRLVTAAGLPAAPDGVMAAMVFAPGAALTRSDGVRQMRGCTVGVDCDATLKCTAAGAPKCNPANYLDATLGEDNADLLPSPNPRFVSAERSASFNDRLMPVYSDDIMWLVQRRAGREYAQHLRDHFDAWQTPPAVANTTYNNFRGFYPWAAPLDDPTAMQPGVNNTQIGELPLSAAQVLWDVPAATLGVCVGANTAQIQCTATSSLGLLTITGSVRNVGTAFVDPPNAGSVSVAGIALGPQTAWTYNAATQTLDFTWSATLLGVVTVTASAPAASAWTTASPNWLADNGWQQNALYAVSPGYAFSGAAACTPGGTPACVTVANTAPPNNDKQAVVLMTGRALAPSTASPPCSTNPMPCIQAVRPLAPPATPGQLLEGANATAAAGALLLEQNLHSVTFNDLPVVVRP